MRPNAEIQRIIRDQQYAFRLKNLFHKDRPLFNELTEYLPFSIHVNNRQTLDIVYADSNFLNKGKEVQMLAEHGGSYLFKISNLNLLNAAIVKANIFDKLDDESGICSYPQMISLNGEMTFIYTYKLILDSTDFFNFSYFPDSDLGKIGKVVTEILSHLRVSDCSWRKIHTLTKQEKAILKLIGTGASNNSISDQLFISVNTVKTHRRNIKAKLDVDSLADLIKFALCLDLL